MLTSLLSAIRATPSAARVTTLLFLAIALPLGLIMAELTPLGQVADEGAHALRAEALLTRQLAGHRAIITNNGPTHVGAVVDADLALLFAMFPPTPLDVTRDQVDTKAGYHWLKSPGAAEITPLAIYAPFFYVPAAIALEFAKRTGLGPAAAGTTGRLVNLAVFLLLGSAALLLARRGRALLFCTLSLPMTLSLAASFSQDGLIIASSTLAAALLSRGGGAADRPMRHPSYLVATLLLAMIIMVKPPYAPLAALLLVPLRRASASSWAGRLLALTLVAVPAALWTVYAQADIAALVQHPLAPAGPLWPGGPGDMFSVSDPALQLHVLLAHPRLILTLPWTTISHDSWILPQIAGVLGWLAIPLPHWLYVTWAVAFIVACSADLLGRDDRGLALGWPDTVWLLAAAIACVLAIYLSQYLVWTAIGAARIEGPQGRYLTPLIPLLAVALPRFATPRWRSWLIAAPAGAAALGLVVVPWLLVSNFYLR